MAKSTRRKPGTPGQALKRQRKHQKGVEERAKTGGRKYFADSKSVSKADYQKHKSVMGFSGGSALDKEGMKKQAERKAREKEQITKAKAQEGLDVEKAKKGIVLEKKEKERQRKEAEGRDILLNPREPSGETEGMDREGWGNLPQEAMGVGEASAMDAGDILALSGIGGMAKAGVGAGVKAVISRLAQKQALKQALKQARAVAEQEIVKNVLNAQNGRMAWNIFTTGARTIRFMRGSGGEIKLTQKVITGKPIDFTYPLKVAEKIISPKLLFPKTEIGIQAVKTNPKTLGLTSRILLIAGATISGASLIMGIAGTYPFSKFVGKEEAIQTLSFPIKAAIDVGRYDVAEDLIDDVDSLINIKQSKIPIKNVNDAMITFVNDAALPASVAWRKILNEHKAISEGERETQFDINRKAYDK